MTELVDFITDLLTGAQVIALSLAVAESCGPARPATVVLPA